MNETLEQVFVEGGLIRDMNNHEVKARPLLVDMLSMSPGEDSKQKAIQRAPPGADAYATGLYRDITKENKISCGVVYFKIYYRK